MTRQHLEEQEQKMSELIGAASRRRRFSERRLTSLKASWARERKDRMTPMMVILFNTLSTAASTQRSTVSCGSCESADNHKVCVCVCLQVSFLKRAAMCSGLSKLVLIWVSTSMFSTTSFYTHGHESQLG